MKKFIVSLLLLAPMFAIAQADSTAVDPTDVVQTGLPDWLEAIIGAGGFALVLRVLSLFAPNVTANLVTWIASLMSPRVGKVIGIARMLWENSQANSPEGSRWSKSEEENFWEAVRNFNK